MPLGLGASSSSAAAKLSFSIVCNGFPLEFLGAGFFFSLFELGGVLERREASWSELWSRSRSEFSSSDSGFARFLPAAGFAVILSFDCASFLDAALGAFGSLGAFGFAAAFLGAAFGF